jgi:hypothetical protein
LIRQYEQGHNYEDDDDYDPNLERVYQEYIKKEKHTSADDDDDIVTEHPP